MMSWMKVIFSECIRSMGGHLLGAHQNSSLVRPHGSRSSAPRDVVPVGACLTVKEAEDVVHKPFAFETSAPRMLFSERIKSWLFRYFVCMYSIGFGGMPHLAGYLAVEELIEEAQGELTLIRKMIGLTRMKMVESQRKLKSLGRPSSIRSKGRPSSIHLQNRDLHITSPQLLNKSFHKNTDWSEAAIDQSDRGMRRRLPETWTNDRSEGSSCDFSSRTRRRRCGLRTPRANEQRRR